MTDITITDVPTQTVLGMRRRGFYQEQIPAMIMELFSYVEEKGIAIAGMPVFICHETTPEEAIRAAEEGDADIEVAIPMPSSVAIAADGPEGMTQYELPGGPMVKAIHKGPYATEEETYNEVFAWMAEHGKEVTGPIREIYINNPAEVPEGDLLTEIYVPVG